jgi:hypothetical protein
VATTTKKQTGKQGLQKQRQTRNLKEGQQKEADREEGWQKQRQTRE